MNTSPIASATVQHRWVHGTNPWQGASMVLSAALVGGVSSQASRHTVGRLVPSASFDAAIALYERGEWEPAFEMLQRLADTGDVLAAKLVLLTAYADTEVAIKAINDIGLDHYLMKPWAPPEERLFPIIDDLLGDWEVENGHRFDGIRVIGNRWSERSHDTKMFLARNHVQYQWLELERDGYRELAA